MPELQRAVFSGAAEYVRRRCLHCCMDAARWELPDPETSGTWSAAAYLAAKELAQTQGVPVGIIGCNYGGSSVSCWLPESDLQAHAAGHPYLQDYADAAAGKTDAEMIAEYDEYVAYHTAWESRMQKCYQEDSNMPWDEIIRRCGENRYPGPLGIKSPYRPAGMYHTMLQRVVPYTIRGFFYYQGENDEIRPDTYGTLLTMLIAAGGRILKMYSCRSFWCSCPCTPMRTRRKTGRGAGCGRHRCRYTRR